jgi:hypothetical protein
MIPYILAAAILACRAPCSHGPLLARVGPARRRAVRRLVDDEHRDTRFPFLFGAGLFVLLAALTGVPRDGGASS